MLSKSARGEDYSNMSNCSYGKTELHVRSDNMIFIQDCDFVHTKHSHVQYENLYIDRCNFENSIFSNVTFNFSNIINTSFKGATFVDSYINELLIGCNFNDVELVNTKFHHATIENCTFAGAKLNNVLFNKETYKSDLHAMQLAVLSSMLSRSIKRSVTVPDVMDKVGVGVLLRDASIHNLSDTIQFKNVSKW